MSMWDLSSADAVRQAMTEFDEIGREAFLAKYGFKASSVYFVVHEGKRYDSKPLLAAAHGYQFPDAGPLENEFSGGTGGAKAKLESLGFEFVEDITPVQIRSRFRAMRVGNLGTGEPAPHKPLLCLLALRRLRDGEDRLARPSEFADELRPLLEKALPDVADPSSWEPIWRLESDIWDVIDRTDGSDLRTDAGGDAPVGRLREEQVRCGLAEEIVDVLDNSPHWIERIEDDLVERFLSGVPAEVVAAARGRAKSPTVWWLNQGKTYRQARDSGLIWAPTVTKGGYPAAHHEAVSRVQPGDIVLHYSSGAVRAIGKVTSTAVIVPKPEAFPKASWEKDGYQAEVQYFELETPIQLQQIPGRSTDVGPFDVNGGAKQGYLFEVDPGWAASVRSALEERWPAGSPWGAGQYWLFQANSNRWDLAKHLETWRVGDVEDWTASRYRNDISVGDGVLLFLAGESGGILATATVDSDIYMRPRPDWAPEGPDEEPCVDVRLDQRLDPPLARELLKSHPILKDLGVLKFANATNFKVTEQEWNAVQHLIGNAPNPLDAVVERFQASGEYTDEFHKKFEVQRQKIESMLSEEALQRIIDGEETLLFSWLNSQAFGFLGSAGMQLSKAAQAGHGPQLAQTIGDLLYGEGPLEERIEAATDEMTLVPGINRPVINKVLAATDPHRWIPYFTSAAKYGRVDLAHHLGLGDLSDLPPTERFIRSNDVLREALEPYFGDNTIAMRAFLWFVRQELATEQLEPNALEQLAQRLFLPTDFIEEALDLLHDKGQTIFYGPPGTGKTYVAMAIAEHLTDEDAIELVQFHPSYSYEDFVEGFRPTEAASFVLRHGPLRRMADAAVEDPGRPYVLIIDEINRGNVAKVFGELYFLLEYRDRSAHLQYSDKPLRLPENLFIIGTMNSADRSIGLLDGALRRRFHFVSFYPDDDAIREMLPKWVDSNAPDMAWVVQALNRANALLDDRHLMIGPSHFLRPDLTEDKVYKTWKHSVLPYIADQFFGREHELDKFKLDKLRAASSPAQDDSIEQPSDDTSD